MAKEQINRMSDRWRQVEEIFQLALELEPTARIGYVKQACDDDDELRCDTLSLLSAYEEAGEFIEESAISKHGSALFGDETFDLTAKLVGHYRVLQLISAGGMGRVYLALDERLNRQVALKILPSYYVSDPSRLKRFQQEARAASSLNHPNLLTVLEVGEFEGIHFIATEFIDGQTIRELAANQPIQLERVLDIAVQTATGLAVAHAAGIVHRDIKPENIMRRPDGIVKILDFGIAKLRESSATDQSAEGAAHTEAGVILGTVGYMSPEQARGLLVDDRSDIWSLGCVIYEMVAQTPPFLRPTRIDTLVAVLERDPLPLSQNEGDTRAGIKELDRIVSKTLQKDQTERYQTVTELLSDLKGLQQQLLLRTAQSEMTLVPSGEVAGGGSLVDDLSCILLKESHTKSSRWRTRSRRAYLYAAYLALVLLILTLTGTLLFKRLASSHNSQASNGPVDAHPGTTKLWFDMNGAERTAFIDEQEHHISEMLGDRRVKLNDEALGAIRGHIDRYVARTESTSDEPGKESLNLIYSRAAPFLPEIRRAFAARKVPIIIGIYLPMIESEYKPCFRNIIGATGLFQFMPATAKRYGVAQQDMCDVSQMTPAAAHYIADLMAELGDDSQSMTLVLLGYNRGEEGVRYALRELRDHEHYERNFWALYANREKLDKGFQTENANYVPGFFAAAIIGENPAVFGLEQPALSTLAESDSSFK